MSYKGLRSLRERVNFCRGSMTITLIYSPFVFHPDQVSQWGQRFESSKRHQSFSRQIQRVERKDRPAGSLFGSCLGRFG